MNFAKLNLDGLTSQSGQKIAKQHVRARLEVYPHSNDAVWKNRKSKVRTFSWDADKTEGTILSLNTIKTMGAPSGTWQAVVKLSGDSDLDISRGDIMDGDWVDITYLRNGIEFAVMRGVVDTARQRKISAGGATVKVFNLTGRDHGAPFETPICWQSFWVQTLGELFRGLMTDKVKGAIGGSPDEMFELLISAAMERRGTGGIGSPAGVTNRSSWTLPHSLAKISVADTTEEGRRRLFRPYFYEALHISAGRTRGAYYNEVQLWTQPGQTLHQTLQLWCNPLLNEIYYDLRDGLKKVGGGLRPKMWAFLRERPFVNTIDGMNSPWYQLETLELPSWIIQDYDTGRDGSQRYNLIELIADFGFINPQEAAAAAPPIWNFTNVQTHGLKPWQQNVRYVAKDGKAQGQWLEERRAWQQLVVDWYGPNPYLLNGTLGAGVLLPEARIGSRVKYDTGSQDSSENYYLEGVENKYSFDRAGHHGKTTLTVTRGWPGSGKAYLDMVTKAVKDYREVF